MNIKVKTFLESFSFIFVFIGFSIGVVHFLLWIQDQVPGWVFFWLITGVVCNGIISLSIASDAKADKEKNNVD